jgi:hypothetical protein
VRRAQWNRVLWKTEFKPRIAGGRASLLDKEESPAT